MNTKEQNLPQGEEQNGSLTIRRNRTVDLLAKIICLLLAVFLWYYISDIDEVVREEKYSSVPVEIVNESGFSVLSGGDTTVDITVAGKRAVITKVKKEDIRCYAEVGAIKEPGRYRLDLHYELPNGVTLADAPVDSVTVYMDNTTSVSVPVRVNLLHWALEEGYELDRSRITTDRTTVTVTGPEAVVNTIDCARLDVDIAGYRLTRTVTCNGELILADKSGNAVVNSYVKCGASTATATVPVLKYRDVPVTVTCKNGYFGESSCTVTASPASVRIKGEADIVDAVVLNYVIDEKTLTDAAGASYTYGVSLPAGVENVNGTETVSVELRLFGYSVKNMYIMSLEIINPKGYPVSPVSLPITVKVMGTSGFYPTGRASVDLSDYDGTPGTVSLPLTLILPDGVFELGSYNISVTVTEEGSE